MTTTETLTGRALQTSPGIYWLVPHLVTEYSVSMELEADAHPSTRRAMLGMRDERNQELLTKIPRTWAGVTTTDEIERRRDEYRTIYRRRAYEQPAWTRVEVYRMPHPMTTFRIAPQGKPIIDLELRRLSYLGDPALGALHDGVLYVVLVVEPTT